MIGRAVAIWVTVFLSACTVASARPGDLDPQFGRHGFAHVESPGQRTIARAMDVDAADRVVIGGIEYESGETALHVVRTLPNGKPDPAFGSGGHSQIYLGERMGVSGTSTDSLGRVLVTGNLGPDLFVARLLAGGELDRDFADGGIFTASAGTGLRTSGEDVIAASGDGVVVVGASGPVGSPTADWLVTVRLDPAGRPLGDPAAPGLTSWTYAAGEGASGLRVTGDGAGGFYVAGESGGRLGIARFDSEGRPVRTFGQYGFAAFKPPGSGPTATVVGLAPDSLGRLIVAFNYCSYARYTYCRPVAARITSNGALDPTFADDGWWTGLRYGSLTGVAVAGGDSIVLSATLGQPGAQSERFDFAVLRLLTDGSLDRSFSGDGLARIDHDFSHETSWGVAIQSSGAMVVGGDTAGPDDVYEEGFLAARYEVRRGKPDADADRLADRVDRCPARYGTGRSGCPLIGRSVSIWPDRRDRVNIEVDAKAFDCRLSKVRILRGDAGIDTLLLERWTSDYGLLTANVDGPLRGVYAVAVRRRADSTAVCRAARSGKLDPPR